MDCAGVADMAGILSSWDKPDPIEVRPPLSAEVKLLSAWDMCNAVQYVIWIWLGVIRHSCGVNDGGDRAA